MIVRAVVVSVVFSYLSFLGIHVGARGTMGTLEPPFARPLHIGPSGAAPGHGPQVDPQNQEYK